MRNNWRKTAATILFVSLALLIAFTFASEITVSQFRSWEASRLLVRIQELHPGVTTESEAKDILERCNFCGSFEASKEGEEETAATYNLYNSPEWIGLAVAHFPVSWGEHVLLPWTLFEVHIYYRDSLVKEIYILEMQEAGPGYPHPNAVSVDLLSTRFTRKGTSTIENFNGYTEYSRSTRGYDEHRQPTNFECCRERFITLDERASSAQLAQALKFQLRCMTSYRRCRNDRQLLP